MRANKIMIGINMKKKTLFILVLISVMLFIFASLAETVDELKQIYVTRDEIAVWASSESQYLSTLEVGGQEKVQKEVMYQMWKRNISDKSLETISSSEMQSMVDRRESEIRNYVPTSAP